MIYQEKELIKIKEREKKIDREQKAKEQREKLREQRMRQKELDRLKSFEEDTKPLEKNPTSSLANFEIDKSQKN